MTCQCGIELLFVAGTIMFQLRRRTADMPPAKRKKKKVSREDAEERAMLPYLVEINPG